MRKQWPVALVVEGSSTTSSTLRLPLLVQELGPIKSAALRVARRQSNSLRAGYAVSDYEDLQAARLVLLHVPDTSVDRIVAEICASELVFKGISFVLCESWLPLEVLHPLSDRGAAIATTVVVPNRRQDWFIVEGQITANRQIRRLLERSDARTSELRPGAKHLLFAAELLTRTLPVVLFSTAEQALRASGISGNNLFTLLDTMVQRTVKDVIRAPRSGPVAPLGECTEEVTGDYLQRLRHTHPDIAGFVDELLYAALRRTKPEIPSAVTKALSSRMQ